MATNTGTNTPNVLWVFGINLAPSLSLSLSDHFLLTNSQSMDNLTLRLSLSPHHEHANVNYLLLNHSSIYLGHFLYMYIFMNPFVAILTCLLYIVVRKAHQDNSTSVNNVIINPEREREGWQYFRVDSGAN